MATRFDDWEGDFLAHYGVLGMKWGQRRFQNSDGSLTAAGKKRYEKTGEYGYQYHSHTTKKYNRKAERQRVKAKIYRDSVKEVKSENDHNDFHEKRNNRFADRWEKKARKYDEKAAKYERRAKRSEELDRREQDYAQRVRTSGNIAMRLLTSTIGGKAYQQHLAMNKDTTSRGSKVTAAILGHFGGRIGSMLRKASYLRQDERAAKRAAKGKAADRGAAFRERAAAAKAAFESTVNKADNYAQNAYDEQRRKRQNRG